MNKAAFLDRDGVINRKAPEGEYVTRWEDFHFLPGAAEAIGLLNRADFRVIVVSNQRCIAKGLLSIPDLESMHLRMCHELAAAGSKIDAIYYCPHENEPSCGCRKPAPGMLLAAAAAHQIDLAASWMIGDSEADMDAGRTAGCRTARILRSGHMTSRTPDVVSPSLLEAVDQILRREGVLADRQHNAKV